MEIINEVIKECLVILYPENQTTSEVVENFNADTMNGHLFHFNSLPLNFTVQIMCYKTKRGWYQ